MSSLSLAPSSMLVQDVGVSTTRDRRRFTAAFKLKILEEAARCVAPGALGALLRREGLYSSHLSVWRAAAKRGELTGRTTRCGKPRGPTSSAISSGSTTRPGGTRRLATRAPSTLSGRQ